ncbi:MAG: hypothetical protein IJP22_01705 [Clostridia bacterium]|nr:hypothetical protein [Clostridia bacterium]
MKGFFKFLGSVFAVFTGLIGALAVYDAIKNKNRLKGAYLECGNNEASEENE